MNLIMMAVQIWRYFKYQFSAPRHHNSIICVILQRLWCSAHFTLEHIRDSALESRQSEPTASPPSPLVWQHDSTHVLRKSLIFVFRQELVLWYAFVVVLVVSQYISWGVSLVVFPSVLRMCFKSSRCPTMSLCHLWELQEHSGLGGPVSDMVCIAALIMDYIFIIV